MKLKAFKGNLNGIKIKTPKGVIGFWKSHWNAGVWLTETETSTRIYPQFINDLQDVLEWEITEEDSNCHKLLDMEYIDNKTQE